MLRELRPAVVSVLVFALVTGMVFPAVVTAIARVAFPRQANGSLLERSGRIVGSNLIGQRFTGPRYFHGRPSSAGQGYDATASGGSNLGPTNPRLIEGTRRLAIAYRIENGLPENARLPSDAVTGSASGLDPDISPANAMLQAVRVAKARGLSEQAVRRIVVRHMETRTFGLLGEPRVNVLMTNLDLDAMSSGR